MTDDSNNSALNWQGLNAILRVGPIMKHDITGLIEAGPSVGALPVALQDNPRAAVPPPHPLIPRCDATQPQLEKTQ